MSYPFVAIPLNFTYNALEPYIDTQTMHLHHDRHYEGYVNKLNSILKDYPQFQKLSLKQLLCQSFFMPPAIRTDVKNNAGGVFNHQFYFDVLSNPGKAPMGNLLSAIKAKFKTTENFFAVLKEKALSVFGSGYAWVVANKNKEIDIITLPNQDTPICLGLSPVLPVDVWEHAYYLKHFNLRANYIDNLFKVLNFEKAEKNFNKL